MRIFISYGRDEYVTLARRIQKDLLARGHEVWFDEEKIKEGGDWEQYIEEGLNFCAAPPGEGRVVLLMTPHSVRRPDGYCLNEIAAAINRKMLIIPVMVVWCEPPLSICRIQWLDMQDCVPVSERRERYELKRQRLLEALEQGKLDFEATQADLIRTLQPLDFAADLAEHVTKFVGRQWALDIIGGWLAKPQASRIFWITGPPGVGKTALAAYLCRRLPVVAVHFCRHGHTDKADPRRCVMSLAYQLGTQLYDYQQRLVPRLYDLPTKSAATLFDNLIVQPLAQLPRSPANDVLMVIDGLDEATRHGRNDLAEFLAREFPRTPPWLRLIVTSRPDPEVRDPLQKLSPFYLDTSSAENLQDLNAYLFNELPLLTPDRNLPEERILKTLLAKSEGIFLYVDLVLSDLREGRLTLEQVEDFPQGLGEAFHLFFRRQFPDISAYRQRHRPFLEMIIAARNALPLELAKAELGWGPYDFQLNVRGEARGEALAPLGSLFTQTPGHIRPFHRAIVQWLTDPARAGDYCVDQRQGQSRLAEACWREFKSGVEKMSPYAQAHLPGHLLEVERWEDLLELVTAPSIGLVNRWLETGDGEQGLTCLAGLFYYLTRQNLKPELAAGLATQAARIHSQWGEYDQAHTWLARALERTSWWRGRRARAIACHELGSLALYRGEYKEAKLHYHRALRLCLWGWTVYRDEAAANLIGLATVAHVQYDFAKAIRLAQRGIKEAKKDGDLRHHIAGERLLGMAHKSLGNYQESEEHLESALRFAETAGAPLEIPRLLLLMGWLHYNLATLAGAPLTLPREYFAKADDAARVVQDYYCRFESQLSLGWCALVAGEADIAMSYFEPYKDVLPADRHRELQAMLKVCVAVLAYVQGESKKAKTAYQDAIFFCQAHDFRTWRCRALVGLGAIYWHHGREEEGEKCWQEGLQIAKGFSHLKHRLTQISIARCRETPGLPPL